MPIVERDDDLSRRAIPPGPRSRVARGGTRTDPESRRGRFVSRLALPPFRRIVPLPVRCAEPGERPAHQRAGRGAVRPNRGRHRTRRQTQRRTAMRFFGLIAVLVVAASIASASAQTHTRIAHHGSPALELTYTKWI